MRKEFLLAIMAGVIVTTSCNEKSVNIENSEALKVGDMMNVSFNSGKPETRVVLNPYGGTTTTWSSFEKIDTYDLTNGFFNTPDDPGISRFSTLIGEENPGDDNTNAFRGQQPVTNVSDPLPDGSVNVNVNFATFYPTQDNLKRGVAQGKIPAASLIEFSQDGNHDILRLNLPKTWSYEANVQDVTATDIFDSYGEFLPYMSVPVVGRTINIKDGVSKAADGKGDIVLDFMQLFHLAQVVIDSESINYDEVGDIVAHQMIATIDLQRPTEAELESNVFVGSHRWIIENIANLPNTDEALNAGVWALDAAETRKTTTSSMTLNYVTADGTPVEITPLQRQGQASTISFPIPVPPTQDAVDYFKLTIEFINLAKETVMVIEKEVNIPSTVTKWEFGQASKINVDYSHFDRSYIPVN